MGKDFDDDEKDELRNKIVLIHDAMKDYPVLTEEEQQVKQLLLEIEAKVNSMERVRAAMTKEYPDSIFATEVFSTMVGAIAISAASDIIADFFGLPKERIDQIF